MTAEEVLIVPFMELKLKSVVQLALQNGSLNRTFYGIETRAPRWSS